MSELDQLVARLDALDSAPISTHPAVLDEVHRALVGELERLAGLVSGAAGGKAQQSDVTH